MSEPGKPPTLAEVRRELWSLVRNSEAFHAVVEGAAKGLEDRASHAEAGAPHVGKIGDARELGERLDVLRRLDQHQRDIGQALKRGTKYGKRAEAILSDSVRCDSVNDHESLAREAVETAREFRPVRREARAFGSAGGATASAPGEASAFVPPGILG